MVSPPRVAGDATLPTSVPVIIVGAGPTGLAAGNLLGQAGIETIILERNAGLSSYCKAVSIDDEGLRICQAMGLHEAMLHCMISGVEAQYVAGRQMLARVAVGDNRNGFPLISTFLQPEFEAVLYEGLRRFSCVTIGFEHAVEGIEQKDSCALASVRTPEGDVRVIECAYLLACDGGRSAIRHALGVAMQAAPLHFPLFSRRGREGIGQKWLVVDGKDAQHDAHIVTFYCNPQRPAVSVPTPHHGRRWEFMLLPGENEWEMLRQEKLAALIEQAGGRASFQVERKAVYRFHALVAAAFARERVFLLGDAAHLMPPFGGQGMNSGLRDAHNLCWKLALVMTKRASADSLRSYQQERREAVIEMIRFSSFLGNIITLKPRPAALARNALFALLNTIPPVRDIFTEARIKPQPKYARGFFLPGEHRDGQALAGLMLPQPVVVDAAGRRVLLDEVLGQGFAILRISDKPEEAFGAIQGEVWQRLAVRRVCLSPQQSPHEASKARASGQQTNVWVNSASITNVYLSPVVDLPWQSKELFVLVRPDRYILGAFRAQKRDDFEKALQAMLD